MIYLRFVFCVVLALLLILYTVCTYRDTKAYYEEGHVPYTKAEKRKRVVLWISLPVMLLIGVPLFAASVPSGYQEILLGLLGVGGIVLVRHLSDLFLMYFNYKSQKKK